MVIWFSTKFCPQLTREHFKVIVNNLKNNGWENKFEEIYHAANDKMKTQIKAIFE